MLDSLPIVEAEANPHVPELGAEAPGPHILEMETAKSASQVETSERALQLETKRPIAELEGSSDATLAAKDCPTGVTGIEETRLYSYALRQQATQS